MYPLVLFVHLVAATIWTGGHLVLALAWLPRVLRERSPADLLRFEQAYERVGMPALLVQVASGLWLAHRFVPDLGEWLQPDKPPARAVACKLGLLALTVAIAAHARFRVIPRLSAATLPLMAAHVVAVTLLSLGFAAVGLSFRFGGV